MMGVSGSMSAAGAALIAAPARGPAYLCDAEPAHRLMPPSCASWSIAASSSALKLRFCKAATFSRICALLLAPISVDVTRASRSTQASAICASRSEEHTSELQSLRHLVCRLLLEKKKTHDKTIRACEHSNSIASCGTRVGDC